MAKIFRILGRCIISFIFFYLCYDKFTNPGSYSLEAVTQASPEIIKVLIYILAAFEALLGLYIVIGDMLGAKLFFVYCLLFTAMTFSKLHSPDIINRNLSEIIRLIVLNGCAIVFLDKSHIRKKPKPV